LYTSAIYNKAIATSNTEVIANSVIIIFVTDVDELAYGILMLVNKCWVEGLTQQDEVQGSAIINHDGPHGPQMSNGTSQDEVAILKKEVEALREAVELLMKQQKKVKMNVPQDVHENKGSVLSNPIVHLLRMYRKMFMSASSLLDQREALVLLRKSSVLSNHHPNRPSSSGENRCQ